MGNVTTSADNEDVAYILEQAEQSSEFKFKPERDSTYDDLQSLGPCTVSSHYNIDASAGSSVAALSSGRVRVKLVQAAAAGGAGVRRAPAGSRSQSAAPAGQHAATPTDSRWRRERRTPQRPRLLFRSLLTC